MKVKKNMDLVTEDSLHKVLSQNIKEEIEDLSPEDETRRKRRRERNKVAAEKCRNKKKKEILKLFAESEMVEKANACYKDELSRLEEEEKHLIKILETHRLVCKLQRGSSVSQPYWTDHNSSSSTRVEHEIGKSIADNIINYIGDNTANNIVDTAGDYIVDNAGDYIVDNAGDYNVDNAGDYIVDNAVDYIVDNTGDYNVNNVDNYEDTNNVVKIRKRDERMSNPCYLYPGYIYSGYSGSACAV